MPDARPLAYAALSDLGPRYGLLSRCADLTPFERRLFSQNGEDGVLLEILHRVGVDQGWFIEFGAGTGHEGNCVLLADVLGWEGIFLEGDPSFYARLEAKYHGSHRIRTAHALVGPETADALFESHGAPEEPDVLSIDVDGDDWWIWQAITRVRPRVVIIEYNATLPVDRALVRPRSDRGWDSTAWFGASLGAYEHLGAEKGYRLVHTELTGTNAFFVRTDLLGSLADVEPPRRAANLMLTGVTLEPDPEGRPWLDLDAV